MHYITLLSSLVGFTNHTTEIVKIVSNQGMYLLHGQLEKDDGQSICPLCGGKMHAYNKYETNPRHLFRPPAELPLVHQVALVLSSL
jgi:hypothetical protein